MQIAPQGLFGISLAHDFRGVLEVQRRTHRRGAIHKIIVLHHIGIQPAEEKQRLIHFDVARVDRDDQMARVEKGRAILIHELHQREEDGAAGTSEFRVDGQLMAKWLIL